MRWYSGNLPLLASTAPESTLHSKWRGGECKWFNCFIEERTWCARARVRSRDPQVDMRFVWCWLGGRLVGWGGIDEDGATSGVSVHLHEKVQRRMGSSSSRSPRWEMYQFKVNTIHLALWVQSSRAHLDTPLHFPQLPLDNYTHLVWCFTCIDDDDDLYQLIEFSLVAFMNEWMNYIPIESVIRFCLHQWYYYIESQ